MGLKGERVGDAVLKHAKNYSSTWAEDHAPTMLSCTQDGQSQVDDRFTASTNGERRQPSFQTTTPSPPPTQASEEVHQERCISGNPTNPTDCSRVHTPSPPATSP